MLHTTYFCMYTSSWFSLKTQLLKTKRAVELLRGVLLQFT